jgi:hypothetical protein
MIFLAGEFYEASRKLAQWHYFSSSGNVKYIAEYLLLLLKSLQLFRTKIRLIYQHLVGSGKWERFHQEPFFVRSLFSTETFFYQEHFFIRSLLLSGTFYYQEPFFQELFSFRRLFFLGTLFS